MLLPSLFSFSRPELCPPIPQDVLRYHPCPLCGRDGGKVLARRGYPGVPLRNVICTGCGLIRIDPRPNDEWYRKFYEEDFITYLRPYERPAYVETLERTLDPEYQTTFRRHEKPFLWDYVREGGRVLDIGAGFGQILYELREGKRTTVVGLEPNAACSKIAREKFGLELIPESIEQYFSHSQEKFDFVVMDQLFEHLMQPLPVLEQVRDRLTPEGAIYLSVPNSWNSQVSIDKYFEVAHTFGYTPYTMGRIAERCGLKVARVSDALQGAIQVILVRRDSSYPAVPAADLQAGADWRQVVRRLRRKRLLNVTRGLARRIGNAVVGERATQRVRSWFDRLVGFRY